MFPFLSYLGRWFQTIVLEIFIWDLRDIIKQISISNAVQFEYVWHWMIRQWKNKTLSLLILKVLKYSGHQLERRLIMQKSYSRGWRKLSLSLIAYSNLTILMQLMEYLKFVLLLPKCCTLYAVKPSPSVTKVLLHFDNAQRDWLETIIKGNLTCGTCKLVHQVGWIEFERLK